MSRDPEFFRGMTSGEILSLLIADEAAARHAQARAIGAKCASCMDTGMNGGAFCSCSAGATIAYQGNRP